MESWNGSGLAQPGGGGGNSGKKAGGGSRCKSIVIEKYGISLRHDFRLRSSIFGGIILTPF